MTIEMVRDVLNWDMSDYEKIAIIEMLVEDTPTGYEKWQDRIIRRGNLLMAEPPEPKPKVHKGPVAGTYRRGLLWKKLLKADPKAAKRLGYRNAMNKVMEKLLAKAAAKAK